MKNTFVKFLSFAMLLVCIMCIFNGCSAKSKLTGKWYSDDGDLVLTLKSNGKANFLTYEGPYEVTSSYIEIDIDFATIKVYYDFITSRSISAKIYLDSKLIGDMNLYKK